MNNRKKGYVSIEAILVFGLLVFFGVSVTVKNKDGSQKLVDTSLSAMDDLMNSYNNSGSVGGGTTGGTSGGTSGGTTGGGGTTTPDITLPNINNMPTPRNSFATVAVGNKFYSIGGLSGTTPSTALEVFNKTNGRWTKLSDIPIALESISAAVDGSNEIICVHGISEGKSTTIFYGINSNTWSEPVIMDNTFTNATLFTYRNALALYGGTYTNSTGSKVYNQTLYTAPDFVGDFFEVVNLGQSALSPDIFTNGDDIYMVGGTLSTNAHNIYKYGYNSWEKVTTAPTRNVHKGYKAAFSDGYIYLLGATNFYVYDIFLDTWRQLTAPSTSITYCGMYIKDDLIYAIGGKETPDKVRVFSISQNKWILE